MKSDKIKITGDEPANGFAYGELPAVSGITIRQYFAALALQGMLAGHYSTNDISDDADVAVLAADSLISSLNK